MTLIVMPSHVYQSKATLKAALNGQGHVSLHEPSIMGSWTKTPNELPVGFRDTVTRVERDKFATIERTPAGWKVS